MSVLATGSGLNPVAFNTGLISARTLLQAPQTVGWFNCRIIKFVARN